MDTEPIAGPPIPTTERVAELVERAFGATVTAIHRQLRWRPTWFLDLSSGGRTEGLVVRGDRLETQTYPLRHEMAFHSILEEHGIPVPALRGYLDEIDAIVMAKVPGKPDFAGVPDAERDVVVDEYLQALVRVHQLPVEPFVSAGIVHADDPVDSAMVLRTRIIEMWRAAKKQPDPFMEFALGWLLQHPPQSHGRQAPILSFTGQFHHDGGHLVAILDVHPLLGPEESDVVLTRLHGVSVFAGTGLDALLRAQSVTTVVLAGVSTDMAIVCSTAAAVDLGYRVVVPADCVEGFDPEVHRLHLERTLPVIANVSSGDAVLAALSSGVG